MSIEATETLGMPVEISQIGRALKQLWAEGEGAIARASLINLAVYSEEPGSLAHNTRLIAQITEEHACRAIAITADPDAKSERVEAWISAHCHLRHGKKQVCSEQISFLVDGTGLVPSILFSHLDSDLPLYLWWQSQFPARMDPQLWTWVDRLIYDSQGWNSFEEQFRRVEKAQSEAKERLVLCDLNWTRLVYFRLAFAQFFDPPSTHHRFNAINKISIDFAPQYYSTAVLFIGWLAAQLGWDVITKQKNATTLALRNFSGKPLEAELHPTGDVPITSIKARSGEIEFRVRRADCGDLLEVSRGKSGRSCGSQLLPAGESSAVKLLSEELIRGGPHSVYLRAVAKVRALL